MTYTFGAQKARGDAGEALLDQVFATDYEIRPATHAEQRRGIDRIFTRRRTGQRLAVEYKTDYKPLVLVGLQAELSNGERHESILVGG